MIFAQLNGTCTDLNVCILFLNFFLQLIIEILRYCFEHQAINQLQSIIFTTF